MFKYILNIHKVNKHNRFAWYQAKNILITDNTLDTAAAAAEKTPKISFNFTSRQRLDSFTSHLHTPVISCQFWLDSSNISFIIERTRRGLEKKLKTLIFIVNCCQSTYCVRLIEKKWNEIRRVERAVKWAWNAKLLTFCLSSTEARWGIR